MIAAVCSAAEGAREQALALAERALLVQPASTTLLALQAAMLKAMHECAALVQLMPRLHAARHPKLTAAQLGQLASCQ